MRTTSTCGAGMTLGVGRPNPSLSAVPYIYAPRVALDEERPITKGGKQWVAGKRPWRNKGDSLDNVALSDDFRSVRR